MDILVNQMRNIGPFFKVLFICSLVTACGFHLRGQESLPNNLHVLKLECSFTQNWQFCQSLREQLLQSNVVLNNDAELSLRIDPVESNQRTLSLRNDASPAEYLQRLEVQYRLLKTETLQQIFEQTASTERSVQHNSSALLAKERESDEVNTELTRRLAQTIIRQLGVFDRVRVDGILNKLKLQN